jgi:hypothetical protein
LLDFATCDTHNRYGRTKPLFQGLFPLSPLCDDLAMQVRLIFVRVLAILLIGSLVFAPLAVSRAAAIAPGDVRAMSSEMIAGAASVPADEMPCHEHKSETGKNCPFMAICMALCCQGVTPCPTPLATPAFSTFRMMPPLLARLDGIDFPPPSRPPKS